MYTTFFDMVLPETGSSQNGTISGVEGAVRTGTSQNDVFHSRKGSTLVGGLGDDRYYLWDPSWQITEKSGEGVDTIYVGYWGGITMPDNVENLVLESAGATFANGNALANIMLAGPAGTTLDGGKGDDVLVSGGGADVFKIVAGNGSDAVVDFQQGWDAIKLVGYGITSFNQILAGATQVGSDVKIRLSASESLVLRDTQVSSLQASDFNLWTAPQTPSGYKTLTIPFERVNANGWYVNNNAWGSTDKVIGKDYRLTSTYNAADMTKGVTFNWSYDVITADKKILAYPEVMFGYSLWNNTGSNPTDTARVFPVQLSKLDGLTADYDVSIGGNTGGANVAFDIWFSKSASAIGTEHVSNEVMVWLHKGAFESKGALVGTYQKGAFSAKIYHEGTYTALVPDQDVLAGTLDIGDIVDTLKTLGILSSAEYLRTVELGSEVVSGTGSMTINNLDLTVKTTSDTGGTVTQYVTGAGTQVINDEAPAPAGITAFAATAYMAPTITSNGGGSDAAISVAENGTAVTTVAVSDTDEGMPLTYALGGADAALFRIDGTGALGFKAAPDFETPGDIDRDNVYDVTVTVSDGASTDTQNLAVKVTDQVEFAAAALSTIDLRAGFKAGTETLTDAYGNKFTRKTVVNADGSAVATTYTAAGSVAASDEIGAGTQDLTVRHFNAGHQLLGTTQLHVNADGSVLTDEFDVNGARTGSTKVSTGGDGSTITVFYDGVGKLTGSDSVLAGLTKHYDASGKLSGADRVVAGNMVEHLDASLTVVSIDKTIANSDGTKTIQHLDSKSALQSSDLVKVANSSITTYHYDAKSVLQGIHVERLDPGNVVKSISYDAGWKVQGAVITGTALNDSLAGATYGTEFHGGAGSDRINGGSGVDKIYFDTAIGKGDVDTIVSFNAGTDKLVLDRDIFTTLNGGSSLKNAEFVIGSKALNASQHIVYDKANGDLYYDADGSGAQAAVLFAHFATAITLSSSDFMIA